MQETEAGTDTIRAIGYPTNNGKKLEGLVLLGDKFTYWLVDGSDKLEATVNTLRPEYIDMEPETTIAIKDNTFNGTISFRYDRADEAYAASETDALHKFCFGETAAPKIKQDGLTASHRYYSCRIYVSGTLYLPAQQAGTVTERKNFSKGRAVRLVTNNVVTETDAAKVAVKLILLPFAVAVDLAQPILFFLIH
jgi:hypothetical protein